MRLRTWALSLALALGIATGVTTATPAHAASHEYCTLTYNECMNDWSGFGVIKTGAPGWPNEEFNGNNLFRCPANGGGNTDVVTYAGNYGPTDCPYANTSLDYHFQGNAIEQIRFEGTDSCLGTNPNNGQAVLTTCNDPNTGYGGGPGTVFVIYQGPMVPYGCWHTPPDYFWVDKYWSDYYGEEVDLNAPTYNGGNLFFTSTVDNSSCWVSQTN